MRVGMKRLRLEGMLLVILFIPLFCPELHGQQKNRLHDQYRFESLTVDDGLSNNRVRAVLQDNEGFIWFGTKTGISRFDGYKITNYDNIYEDTAISRFSQVREMLCDNFGNIWAGGEYGICSYNPIKDRFERFNDPDNPGRISGTVGMDEDRDSVIWFTNNNEFCSYNPRTKKFRYFSHAPEKYSVIPSGTAGKILVDKFDNIWIGYQNGGLIYYNKSKDTFTLFEADGKPGSLGEDIIERLYEDNEGNLWIGFNNNGFSKYNRNTKQFTTYFPDPENPESGRVRGLLKDSRGNFWIGTMSGLYRFDEQTGKFVWYAHSSHPVSELSHNSIQCIVLDNQEDLWLGTHAGGVSYTNLNTSGFIRYDYSPIKSPYFLNDKNVYSLAVDRFGNIWAGTEKGGLNYLNRETGKFTSYIFDPHNQNSPLSNNIKDIKVDALNNIWFVTYGGGFSYFDTRSGKFTHYLSTDDNPDGFPVSRIYSILIDPVDSEILWLGAIDGLYSFNVKTKKYFKITEKLPGYVNPPETGSQVYTLNSFQNKLLIGTNSLIVLDLLKHEFKKFSEIQRIPVSSVNFIHIDRNQHIWFDIDNTRLVMSNADFTEFKILTRSEGLPDFEFYEACDDQSGNLWLSTNKGIVEILNVVNRQDSIRYKVFTKSDNLQSIEFLYHSRAVSPDGEIFFGGINGFNSFYPENIITNKYPPVVHITGLLAGNKKVGINEKISGKILLQEHIAHTKIIKIHHRIRMFSLEFVGLHYASPAKNTFKYMLEGYDDQWNYTDASVRFASYSNLPGGTYYFKVKAANNNGLWSDESVVLRIKIQPPFWKTWWFLSSLGLFVVFMFIFLIRKRESQLRNDKSKMEQKLKEGDLEIKKRKTEIEKQRKTLEEKDRSEEYHRWFNKGQALISDILTKDKNDLKQLSQSLISAIVKYLDVQQGGIFISEEKEENHVVLQLQANYAYNARKLDKKSFNSGEGLVGTCYQQKDTIEIDDLPDTYATLNSGLGENSLKHLLMIPLIHDNEVTGVLELVSFDKINRQKVEFTVKIAENIAAVISSVKANRLIKEMLARTQEQSEELHAQEEEMKQTIEEMKSAQENISMREQSMRGELDKLRTKVTELTRINEEQKKKIIKPGNK